MATPKDKPNNKKTEKKMNDFERDKKEIAKDPNGYLGYHLTKEHVTRFKKIKKRRLHNKMARAANQAHRRKKRR